MAVLLGIQVINNGPSIKIVAEGDARLIYKSHIREIKVVETLVKIDYGAGPLYNIYLNYQEVVIPEAASPEALRDAINFMLKDELGTINANIDTINSKLFYEPLKVDESHEKTVYKGYALTGAKTNEPVWAIQKLVNDKDVITYLWADGNKNFDNIWDNRTELTYQ